MKYNFLEPIKIGPITLKNRVIRPAVAEFIANPDGTVSEQYIEYYRNIAQTELITAYSYQQKEADDVRQMARECAQ